MKKLFLLLACLWYAPTVFAQTEPHPTVVGIADALAKGMCECFNEHALPQFTPTTRKALDKLVEKNVTNRDQARKVLTIKEIMGVSKEMDAINSQEEGEFAECKEDAGIVMMQFSGQITEILAQKTMTEEELDKAVEAQMPKAFSKLSDCKKLYVLYLMN